MSGVVTRRGADSGVYADLFAGQFCSEHDCARHLVGVRWPNGFCCPHCLSVRFVPPDTRGRYLCVNPYCRSQTTVTSGTLFEKTHARLRTWFRVGWGLTVASRWCGTAAMTACMLREGYDVTERTVRRMTGRYLLLMATAERWRLDKDVTVGVTSLNLQDRRVEILLAVERGVGGRSGGRIRIDLVRGEDPVGGFLGRCVRAGSVVQLTSTASRLGSVGSQWRSASASATVPARLGRLGTELRGWFCGPAREFDEACRAFEFRKNQTLGVLEIFEGAPTGRVFAQLIRLAAVTSVDELESS